jgi:hypothetical protein
LIVEVLLYPAKVFDILELPLFTYPDDIWEPLLFKPYEEEALWYNGWDVERRLFEGVE